MKKWWAVTRGCLAAAAMVLLILDTQTALAGAREGIDLCVQTVIPSLFPFFVLSILLTGAVSGRRIRFLAPLRRAFRLPAGSESLLAAGILGGYPVGAQCVSQAFEAGQLSADDANRLLVICNNCGPAFLFGMTAALFNRWYLPWLLWGIQIAGALAAAWIIPGPLLPVRCQNHKPMTLALSLNRAVRIMASVCGWVILFRVVLAFLDRWLLWLLPLDIQVMLSGLMELSNGCVELYRLENMGLRFIVSAGMMNFGGVCVALQTASVIAGGLNMGRYLIGKVFQCGITAILAYAVQMLALPAGQQYQPGIAAGLTAILITAVSCLILRKTKISSSIPRKVGV